MTIFNAISYWGRSSTWWYFVQEWFDRKNVKFMNLLQNLKILAFRKKEFVECVSNGSKKVKAYQFVTSFKLFIFEACKNLDIICYQLTEAPLNYSKYSLHHIDCKPPSLGSLKRQMRLCQFAKYQIDLLIAMNNLTATKYNGLI